MVHVFREQSGSIWFLLATEFMHLFFNQAWAGLSLKKSCFINVIISAISNIFIILTAVILIFFIDLNFQICFTIG